MPHRPLRNAAAAFCCVLALTACRAGASKAAVDYSPGAALPALQTVPPVNAPAAFPSLIGLPLNQASAKLRLTGYLNIWYQGPGVEQASDDQADLAFKNNMVCKQDPDPGTRGVAAGARIVLQVVQPYPSTCDQPSPVPVPTPTTTQAGAGAGAGVGVGGDAATRPEAAPTRDGVLGATGGGSAGNSHAGAEFGRSCARVGATTVIGGKRARCFANRNGGTNWGGY